MRAHRARTELCIKWQSWQPLVAAYYGLDHRDDPSGAANASLAIKSQPRGGLSRHFLPSNRCTVGVAPYAVSRIKTQNLELTMTTHDEQYTQDVDELAADLVGLVRRVGAIGNAAVQELARWSCHTYAGWDTSDERGGDVIEDAIDEAIERLGLDPMAVHRLIGIEVIQ